MSRFDYFVVLAEMRTGSNFLEANLNMFEGLTCLGEAFNPHFVSYPDVNSCLGMGLADREADPLALIDRIKAHEGLAGFRFFNDHDGRALDVALTDSRCAKIILTRNPADSFVSWKIAASTGQWKLTNVTHAKTGQITFDPAEFEGHLEALQQFQVRLMNTLQRSGQTAFYVSYEDLQDIEVMNGLAMWLGCDHRITHLNKKLKKQNPQPMADKVANFPEMAETLARLDRFNLGRTPNFEPRRGPNLPNYVAAPETPLLFMPLRSAPDHTIRGWLAGLDGKSAPACQKNFSQKTLRQWQEAHVGHRSFTVLRHPVARAHVAFCERILSDGDGSFPKIRQALRQVHKVPVPDGNPAPETDPAYDMKAHRAAFLGFLKFLKSNLQAQTATRVDGSWATQLSLLQGMADFGLPDLILREENLRVDLAMLAGQVGQPTMPKVPERGGILHDRLAAIYDAEIEAATRDAYGRDYEAFGFGVWSA